jgi:hypothetical protein
VENSGESQCLEEIERKIATAATQDQHAKSIISGCQSMQQFANNAVISQNV